MVGCDDASVNPSLLSPLSRLVVLVYRERGVYVGVERGWRDRYVGCIYIRRKETGVGG